MANDELLGWVAAVFLILMVVSLVAQGFDACRKNRVLEQFCDETGGVCVGGGAAEVRHRSWLLTVSIESETEAINHHDGVGTSTTIHTTSEYTRVRAPYVATDDFQFRIYPKGCFSRLGTFLGMQDLDSGDPSFDRLFVVQGSDEAKLRELLENPAIRELMRREPRVSLTRKADGGWFFRKLPEGMVELYLEVDERIDDVGRLRLLTLLAGEALDELVSLGSAVER